MEGVNSRNVTNAISQGHTMGLDDFYDWKPSGVATFIMSAGASSEITDFDGWMLRNWWYEISRERGWQ